MDWKSLADDLLGLGLPLLGSAIAGPAGGVVGAMVGNALGVGDDVSPKNVRNALQRGDLKSNMATLRKLESDNRVQLKSLCVEETKVLQTAKTQRMELASRDWYTRNMRPTFGYILALCLLMLVMGGIYAVLWGPGDGGASYIDMLSAMSVFLTAAFAVLGVYVNGRSSEKRAEAGDNRSFLQRIIG